MICYLWYALMRAVFAEAHPRWIYPRGVPAVVVCAADICGGHPYPDLASRPYLPSMVDSQVICWAPSLQLGNLPSAVLTVDGRICQPIMFWRCADWRLVSLFR